MRGSTFTGHHFRLIRRPLLSVVLIALISFLAALPASAKDKKGSKGKDYALIFGTVWDAQARPASGIRVRIRREGDKKPRWELVSDARGEFAQRVPAGAADYVVWADIKGPKDAPKPDTKVHVENDERVDISLHLNR